MRTVEFSPKSSGWSGHVVLAVPSYKERIKIAQELGLAKLMEQNEEAKVESITMLIEKVPSFVKEVHLELDGEKYCSLEETDYEYTKEGYELVQEIGLYLMQGISLGKRSSQP